MKRMDDDLGRTVRDEHPQAPAPSPTALPVPRRSAPGPSLTGHGDAEALYAALGEARRANLAKLDASTPAPSERAAPKVARTVLGALLVGAAVALGKRRRKRSG